MAVSPQKLAANQENSRHSTGPQTPEGKARVRFNPVKHGLLAKEVIVPVGDEQANRGLFDQLLNDLHQHYAPVGPVEELLVEKIAIAWWRHRRATRAEVGEIRVEANRPVDTTGGVNWAEYIENVRKRIEQAVPNADFVTWLQTDDQAAVLGLNEEETVASINKLDPSEHKAWLLQTLEAKKQAASERERRTHERNDRHREAVMLQRSLPPYPGKILRYETTIERQMYRAMAELERLQRARLGAESPETRAQ